MENFVVVKQTKPAHILVSILNFCMANDINRDTYRDRYPNYLFGSILRYDELKSVGVAYNGLMDNYVYSFNVKYNKLREYGVSFETRGSKVTSSSRVVCKVLNYVIRTCAVANQFYDYKDFIDWFYSEVDFTYKDLKAIGIW